jgi:hypothetical protein
MISDDKNGRCFLLGLHNIAVRTNTTEANTELWSIGYPAIQFFFCGLNHVMVVCNAVHRQPVMHRPALYGSHPSPQVSCNFFPAAQMRNYS